MLKYFFKYIKEAIIIFSFSLSFHSNTGNNAWDTAESASSDPDIDNKAKEILSSLNQHYWCHEFIARNVLLCNVASSFVINPVKVILICWASFAWTLESVNMEDDQGSESKAVVYGEDLINTSESLALSTGSN